MFLDEELLSVAGISRPGVRGGIPSKIEFPDPVVDNTRLLINTVSSPADSAQDWRVDCIRPLGVAGVSKRPTSDYNYINFLEASLQLLFFASDATFPGLSVPYATLEGAGFPLVGQRVHVRGVWDPVGDLLTLLWKLPITPLDAPTGWTVAGNLAHAGKQFTTNANMSIGHAAAANTFTGRIFRILRYVNGVLQIDLSDGSITDPSQTTFKCATGQTVTEGGDIIKPVPRGKMDFVGVGTNFLEVPDHPSLDNSGRFEIISKINCPDYTTGTTQMIVGKDLISTGSRSWIIRISTAGQVNFVASTSGSVQDILAASVGGVFVDGSAFWIRMLRELNGDISFYQAPDSAAEPTSWTFLNTVSSVAGPLVNSVHPIRIGNRLGTNIEPFIGRIHRIILRNNGVTTFDVNDNDIYDPDVKTFTAFPGLPVTETGDVIKAA